MNSNMQRTQLPFVAAWLFSIPGVLFADTIDVRFDHAKDGNATQNIDASPGDAIRVTIEQTCPEFFDFVHSSFSEIRVDPTESGGCGRDPQAALAKKNHCILKAQTLEFTHSPDASTYLIEVTRKQGDAEPTGITQEMFQEFTSNNCDIPAQWSASPKKLPDRRYVLNVDSTWALGMSGGFTISSVTDPRYAVIDDPGSVTTPPGSIVVQNGAAEDEYNLGFAGFVHVHNRKWRWKDISIAPTFGIGVGDQNTLSGFAGVGFGAGNIGYINVGWNWRQVDRLPTGQQLGAPPISDNVLSDIPKRVDDGWFIGFSFRFMSPGESFFTGKTVQPDVESDQ